MRPKYREGAKIHPYCGMTCANNAKGTQLGSKASNQTLRGVAQCQAPGCTKRVGSVGGRCSSHKPFVLFPLRLIKTDHESSSMENICLMCRQVPKLSNSHFCGQTCKHNANNNSPMILEVPQGHSTFKSGRARTTLTS